jgi:hypothetical protein
METRQYDPWELEDLTAEDLADIGLDEFELDRFREIAEHPELENYDVARAGRWDRGPRDRDEPSGEESERRFGEWLDDMEKKHGVGPAAGRETAGWREPAGWRRPAGWRDPDSDSDEEAPE